MRLRHNLKVATLLLCLPSLLWSQQAPEPSSEKAESDKPYEMFITRQPGKANLRDLIAEVEEDFFARYNDLNPDDAYDMYCYEYTPTMSHIRKRACEPLFILQQRARNGSDLGFALGGIGGKGAKSLGAALSSVYLESPREMGKNMSRHYEILVENMESFTQSDRELAEIASVMEQLKFRLENFQDN